MSSAEHPGVRKVITGLAEAGLRTRERVLILADDVRTAALAAAALGVDVAPSQ